MESVGPTIGGCYCKVYGEVLGSSMRASPFGFIVIIYIYIYIYGLEPSPILERCLYFLEL
jgi:hypothetical protein